MSTKAIARVRHGASAWRGIRNRYARSGQSQIVFCRDAGISPSTFQVWRRELGRGHTAAEFVDVTPSRPPASR